MSNNVFLYSNCDTKYSSSIELNRKYCHGFSGNELNSKSTLSRTSSISLLIFTMCICGRIMASNAEMAGKTLNFCDYSVLKKHSTCFHGFLCFII